MRLPILSVDCGLPRRGQAFHLVGMPACHSDLLALAVPHPAYRDSSCSVNAHAPFSITARPLAFPPFEITPSNGLSIC
jgi:hypothetical protein